MTDYMPGKATDYMKEANDHTLIVAQIETKSCRSKTLMRSSALKGSMSGVIGPNDLSISLGIPDQMNSDTGGKGY